MVDQDSLRSLRRAVERTANRINERHGGIIDRARNHFLVEISVRVARELSEDDIPHMAAGVAYYALFSIFPIMLCLISVMSFFLTPEQIETSVGEFAGNYLPGSKEIVQDNVSAVIRLRGALGFFSLLGMLWSGSAMFGALNRAINRAWDIHTDRPIYIGKPRQMLMALSVGLLFGASVFVAAAVRTTENFVSLGLPADAFLAQTTGQIMLQTISLTLTITVFMLMYKIMPNTETHWRYIWPGAITSALIFELSKNLFIMYLDKFASYQDVYGSIAPVIVLLFWTYVSSFNVLLGAEICSEYERMKHNVERGVLRHRRHPPSEVPSGPH